ncbi:MAG: hypothetical protein IJJ00_06620 [Erysipelotrichaceae bacterium]|nr:hypothetical protein [Erysipelotrichaceae bacterium]
MTNRNENSNLSGLFIYKNKFNQNVHYDFFTKKAYIISKADEKKYGLFTSRLPLSIIISAMLILVLNVNTYIGIAAGIACYVFMTILFHKSFLENLVVDNKFVKYKRENIFVAVAKDMAIGRIIILIAVSIMIIALAIVNIKTNEMTSQQLLGQYLLMLFAAVFGAFYVIAAYIKVTRKY